MSDIGSDRIRKFGYPKFSDRGNCDPNPIRNFRISELFGSDHRVFGSDTGFSDRITGFSDRVRWNFWKIPIRIRSENPKFFPDIRNFWSDRRIFGSDIFAHPYYSQEMIDELRDTWVKYLNDQTRDDGDWRQWSSFDCTYYLLKLEF